MMMRAQERRLAELEEFLEMYSHTIANSLEVHARTMRDAAREVADGYLAIKDDPQARAAQDKTLITTNGLREAAEIFTEQARRDDVAAEALQHLLDSYGQE